MAIQTKKIEASDAYVEAKKAKAEKRREKLRNIEAKFKGGNEPETNAFNYNMSLIKATNWYNLNADYKVVRSYIQDYLIETDRKKLFTIINRASDVELRSLGFLCRLKSREQFLEKRHEDRIESTITELLDKYNVLKEDKSEETKIEVKPKVDKTKELRSEEHTSELQSH